jgi:protein tyrosine/serine phosphatase
MKPHTLATCAFLFGLSTLASADPAVKGVPNFHTVNDQVLRGGQPTDAGFGKLAAMGVKTIIDLQEEGSRSHDEKKLVKALGMRYINIPMKGMTTPTEKQISHALKALDDTSGGPVFIHCKRGADRTGVVIACYRVKHDGWDNQKALSEARDYGMSWYQFPLQRYVRSYEPRDDSGPAAIADSIREKSVDLAEKVSDKVTGVFGRIKK